VATLKQSVDHPHFETLQTNTIFKPPPPFYSKHYSNPLHQKDLKNLNLFFMRPLTQTLARQDFALHTHSIIHWIFD
jgi:hypothetical protein